MPALPVVPPQVLPSTRPLLTGYALAAGVVVVWSAFSLLGRFSARNGGTGLTPWDLGALRFGIAGVVAGTLSLAGIGRGLGWRRALVLAALGGAGFALPSYAGFAFAPAAHGALLLSGTLPFLVAGGAALLGHEPAGPGRLPSLLVLLAGVGLFGMEAYGRGHAPPGAWRGDLLFLAASVSWAGYTLLARRWAVSAGQAMVAIGLWCGALFVPVWWLLLPSRFAVASAREIAVQAVFQGVVAVLISLWLFTGALNRLGAARLTTVTALVPGVAAVVAVVLLDEPLGLLSVAGLLLVCAAVAMGIRRPAVK